MCVFVCVGVKFLYLCVCVDVFRLIRNVFVT